MSSSYIEVELNHQPVELCKLLKIANLVGGGGEAKIVISEGYVLLNGEVEYQKRKKIYHEDIIEFNGETVQLIINDELEISESNALPVIEPLDKITQAKSPKNKQLGSNKSQLDKANEESTIPTEPKKRRPISF